jgi:hypothetical protein
MAKLRRVSWAVTLLSLSLICSFASCTGITERTEAYPTSLATVETISNQAIVPTPTLRVFSRSDCGDVEENGNILFLKMYMNGDRYRSSYYDLFVMNGNGCFHRMILEEASGSPAWSRDGKYIAIGCDNNSNLCILDAEKTLNSCSTVVSGEGWECVPSILDRFSLPSSVADSNRFDGISWSPNGNQIVIDGEKSLHVLTISTEVWETLIESQWGVEADWSPTQNIMAIPGVKLLDLESSTSELKFS